jgi:hypothetical protein
MSDPATTVASAKAVVSAIKKGVALAKRDGDQDVLVLLLDAQEQALDLRDEIVSLRAENEELRQEIKRLSDAADISGSIVFGDHAYWQRRTDGSLDGPFCSKCYDTEGKLIRPHPQFHMNTRIWQCPNCRSTVKYQRSE